MTDTTSANIDTITTSSNNVKPLLLRWESLRLEAREILKAFGFIHELDLLGHNPVEPPIHLRRLLDLFA
jgi:hypothetical protein